MGTGGGPWSWASIGPLADPFWSKMPDFACKVVLVDQNGPTTWYPSYLVDQLIYMGEVGCGQA